MTDVYFSHIKNPMTIISLFVGLIEIVLGFSLTALSEALQPIIVWFLVLFPTLNALTFFIVLIWFPQNFYGPHDYKSDQSFLTSLQGSTNKGKSEVEELPASVEKDISEQQPLAESEQEEFIEEIWYPLFIEKEYEKAHTLTLEELSHAETEQERFDLRLILGLIKSKMNFQLGENYYQELIREFPNEESVYTALGYLYLNRSYLINRNVKYRSSNKREVSDGLNKRTVGHP